MGSDESHFNVSVGSDGQSHKTVSTNHNLFEEKGEPKRGPSAYQPNALPLGQTGSQYGGRGRGRLYSYRYTVTTRMTPALRWAAMRAILILLICEGQSLMTVSVNHNRFEERGGPKRNRTEALLLTSLTPYR